MPCRRCRRRYRFLDLIMPDSRLGFVLVAKVLPDKAFAALLQVGLLFTKPPVFGAAPVLGWVGSVCFQVSGGDWLQVCSPPSTLAGVSGVRVSACDT